MINFDREMKICKIWETLCAYTSLGLDILRIVFSTLKGQV